MLATEIQKQIDELYRLDQDISVLFSFSFSFLFKMI